jgi:uncharacterized protein YvpB
MIRVADGSRAEAQIPLASFVVDGSPSIPRLERALSARLASVVVRRRGRATLTWRLDARATARRVAASAGRLDTVQAVRSVAAAEVSAPVVAQAQRNSCESAALSILMASLGRPVDQARLQAAFPTSGPLDPVGTGLARQWGDPDRGYVGRPDGGGVAGGFGVYPGPVRATAARYGVRLRELRGGRVGDVVGHLYHGHAVMAWIGLSDGPYGTWTTPEGRTVRVNFGEHTVVLFGVREDGSLRVANPLKGTDETWPSDRFVALWDRLGRRALTS